MKFICVKARPLYDARHVNRILAMLRIHMTEKVTLVCMTDDPYGLHPDIEIVPLTHRGLTGWWHKMQIFEWAQTQEERICYLDLDTVIVGNIDPLAGYQGRFAMLRDFYHGGSNFGSGLMLIEPGFGKELADAFFADPVKAMHDHSPENAPGQSRWGDQYFIERHWPHNVDALQDLFPGLVVSFKVDIAERGVIPHGAGIVCFHGHPRPFHFSGPVTDPWRVL